MKKEFFVDHFPPPAYLSMPALGIDISDRSIKYVELVRKTGKFFVQRFGGHLIPRGIIEGGEIKEKKKVIDLLGSLQRELRVKYIIGALPEEKAFLARIKLPVMKEEEIRGVLELQLEEHVPLSITEAIFDFSVVKGSSDDKHLDVYLIAFPKKIIEDYREVFIKAGFFPLALEMEIQASTRTIVSQNEKGTVVLVDFGRTRTSFGIVSKGEVQFTTTVKVAGEDLEKAIIKNLGVDQVEANKIKKEKGFIKSKDNEKVFNSLLPIASVIKDEIIKCIDYWNSNLEDHDFRRVSRVLLCGGDSNLSGFPEYLSYELRLPVELGNPWVNIVSFEENIPEIELREALIYSVALGLALRSFSALC